MNKERARKLIARKRREESRTRGTIIQVPQSEGFVKRGPGRPSKSVNSSGNAEALSGRGNGVKE